MLIDLMRVETMPTARKSTTTGVADWQLPWLGSVEFEAVARVWSVRSEVPDVASDSPLQVQGGNTYADLVELVTNHLDFLPAEDREWLLGKTAESVLFLVVRQVLLCQAGL